MYYEIWVNTNQFRGNLPLTYSSDQKLTAGALVNVPFKNLIVPGIVAEQVAKPDFPTKPVGEVILPKPLPDPTMQLLDWMLKYYPAPIASHIQLFIPKGITKTVISDIKNTSKSTLKKLEQPTLTNEQELAITKIDSNKTRTILLHGDTASGKTRIYTELIYQTLKSGRTTILLTPEIGLTPQLSLVMQDSFGDRVIIMHSALGEKVRRDNWLKIQQSTEPLVIVGPRSALFAPVSNLGLIIIDEAHEGSYKQEQAPYYQTTRVAAKLAEINNARLLLGTATPLVSDYYFLEAKGLMVVRMRQLAKNAGSEQKPPEIDIVNLSERTNFTKSNWISNRLLKSITKSLSDHEQSLVFLNRRGTALIILCKDCGWRAICPNCDTSLTYHADNHTMNCHSCSFNSKVPTNCPVCASSDIIFKGAGTKAIEQEIRKLFPLATVMRFDRDNKKSESLAENYDDLVSGKINILVGTQIITKGLDLPKLSTVGIVMADNNLYFPDYTAEELTYQMLTQVIGRVARGHVDGRVIIQTYNPEGIALKTAINKQFEAFYAQQISERKLFNFPPFVFLLKLSTKRATSASAQKACEKLIEEINKLNLPVAINGPAPSFHKRVQGKYVWQIIIKSGRRGNLLKIIGNLPANWAYDIDPSSLL